MLVVLTETYYNIVNIQITQRDDFIQIPVFCSGLPTKALCVFLFSPLHAARLAHLCCLDLITVIMFGKECQGEMNENI